MTGLQVCTRKHREVSKIQGPRTELVCLEHNRMDLKGFAQKNYKIRNRLERHQFKAQKQNCRMEKSQLKQSSIAKGSNFRTQANGKNTTGQTATLERISRKNLKIFSASCDRAVCISYKGHQMHVSCCCLPKIKSINPSAGVFFQKPFPKLPKRARNVEKGKSRLVPIVAVTTHLSIQREDACRSSHQVSFCFNQSWHFPCNIEECF